MSALLHAINRSTDKYNKIQSDDWTEEESGGALTILVNSMLSRQEISHQQVMSYLVGGGDKYTSDTYKIIHYGSFERHIIRFWAESDNRPDHQIHREDQPRVNSTVVDQNVHVRTALSSQGVLQDQEERLRRQEDINQLADVTERCVEAFLQPDDQVTLYLQSGSISATNQLQDYLMRPNSRTFNDMGLYEFVGLTEKLTKSRDERRLNSTQSGYSNRRGRPEEERGIFPTEHPQHESHIIRKRTVWVVPVVLGNRMPRPDRDDDERQLWARTVLALFTPWRTPSDLKMPEEEWLESYERQKHIIPPQHLAIIHNMNVLSECKDARDKASAARLAANRPMLFERHRSPSPDPFEVFKRTSGDIDTSVADDEHAVVERTLPLIEALDKTIGIRYRYGIDVCFGSRETHDTADQHGSAYTASEVHMNNLKSIHHKMKQIKRKRRHVDTEDDVGDADRNVRRRMERYPTMDTEHLSNGNSSRGGVSTVRDSDVKECIIDQVILEKNLLSNDEQLRAFKIVANHACFGGNQLLMFVGGVGGTGKSHVVNAILRLFTLLNIRKKILVAAPTGAAAILIGGYTIHSLTLLPESPNKNLQELADIWKGVEYLILDETSMIGASFLSSLNSRLQHAKGSDETLQETPYGGMNIIFTGDFGQLRPVLEKSLYSHKLVNDPGIEQCRDKKSQSALMGVYLWRLVKTVVLLKKNQRQADDQAYAELLNRVRCGECIETARSREQSDHQILQSRCIDRILNADPHGLQRFEDAPIIVGRKRVRDLLNLRIIDHHAKSMSAAVHLYHSKDRILGQPVTDKERELLWKLSSTTTHDSLGRLPLFPGMKVMVQENLAFMNRVVNGSEGTVRNIVYEESQGHRYAVVVYVHIPGSGRVHNMAEEDIVPIFPETSTFKWSIRSDTGIQQYTVTRTQIPLLPAYAYTDYKAQGRSLGAAIVDPVSASSLQGIYVMLSRVRNMSGLAILRNFPEKKLTQRLSQELRAELDRLEALDRITSNKYGRA